MKPKAVICCLACMLVIWWMSAGMASDSKPRIPRIEQEKAEITETAAALPEQTPSLSPRSGEQIKWQVIAIGGNRGTSANFILFGTAGQTAVGKGTSTNFVVHQGFWLNFGPSFVCGDADASTDVDISDAVYLIAYIFAGGPEPNPLLSGDADCSDSVDISDAVYLIAYIFAGGPAPCAGCK